MQEFEGYCVKVVKSRRKTLSAQVKDDKLVVRAPLSVKDEDIRTFLKRHQRWIRNHMEHSSRNREEAEKAGMLTGEEIRSLAEQALKVIPPKVEYYAGQMGVTYGRITIRNQKTRWGSCSSKGNLNFNCLLMLCPEEVMDSVIVHELAHRKEMNHSQCFYAEVFRVFPRYRECHNWLKKNGTVLLKRMIKGPAVSAGHSIPGGPCFMIFMRNSRFPWKIFSERWL